MIFRRAIGLGATLVKSGALSSLLSRSPSSTVANPPAARQGSPLVKVALIGMLGIGGFLVYRHMKKKNATP